MGRRGKDDELWQECKRQVYEIDQSQCLLCQCMTVAEGITFAKSNPYNTAKIDPAHHLPVSQRPDIMYDVNNVFCICREHHNRLDNCRHPITGEVCNSEVTESYWQRIIAKRKENLEGGPRVDLPEFFDEDID